MKKNRTSGHSRKPSRHAGVTLVEILVVAAIAAILLSLAIPSYQRYLQRGHRADAIREMLEIAACQERVRAGGGYYDTTRCVGSPEPGRYRVELQPGGKTETLRYIIVATPVRPVADDPCGTLTLDNAGTRSTNGDLAHRSACWGGR